MSCKTAKKQLQIKYLLLAECVACEFFSSFYGPCAKRAGHENKEGKNEDPWITCRTDRANEANKMFIIWLC